MVRFLKNTATKRASAFFVFLAIVSGIFYYGNVKKQQDITECQLKYNQVFAQVLTLRSQFSNDRQEAVDDVIAGVGQLILHPPTTVQEKKLAGDRYRSLFRTFDEVSKANEKARAENPLPTIPDC